MYKCKLASPRYSLLSRASHYKNLGVRLSISFRMASTLPQTPIFEAISRHNKSSIAVVHSRSQKKFTYGQLVHDVVDAKAKLLESSSSQSPGRRIAYLVENSYDYIVTLLAILASNCIAVPLSSGFPASELNYILDNSEASSLLATEKFRVKAEEVLNSRTDPPNLLVLQKRRDASSESSVPTLESLEDTQSGLMLYTSGTTSRPKGVLLSEATITAQSQSLLEAWEYSSRDHLLHVLPLHHIHGTINALFAPLLAGSTIEFMFPFNATSVWERLASPFENSGKGPDKKVTFLTVVPTIYNRLLASHSSLAPEIQSASREAISPANLRLNISGSAALPTPTKAAWTELSGGNVLLERYGMTEVGMALSCGLDFADRVDGSVGWPLPLVEVRLVDSETNEVLPADQEFDAKGAELVGEIQLRGPTVFREYWRNAAATAAEFVDGGDGRGAWFKTGDVASRRRVEGAGGSKQAWARGPMFFIRGRSSVDIIKTGGEKVSALEIERELLALPQVTEAAVVGVPSDQWGQKVAAVVVLEPAHAMTGRAGKQWGLMDMRRALKDRLVNYKIPQELKVLDGGLPRNAMGKVNKKSLVKAIFPDPDPAASNGV